jgi:hypothetical protein
MRIVIILEKIMYDITKASESYGKKPVWGREFYAQDGAGMYVPVLFVPYFERRIANKTKGEIFIRGIKQIWDDRKRILSKEWAEDNA